MPDVPTPALTVSILKALEKYPEPYRMAWCYYYLCERERDVPVSEAVEQAHLEARLYVYGMKMDPEQARQADKAAWESRRTVDTWALYVELWQEFHDEGCQYRLDLLDREGMIRRLHARWYREQVFRMGRDAHDCVLAQLRGAFYIAGQRRDRDEEIPRLDPEFVMDSRKTSRFKEFKGWATVWWAHEGFEEQTKED